MKAFIVDRYKRNSALRLGEMPEPKVRDHDVLVDIHAASLNQLDAKIRDGEFKLILPYRLPLILGNDVAGVVVRVAPKVRGFKPGDEVYARPSQDRIGTLAERIAMDESDVALKPTNLSMEEAASVPLVGLTAWQVLVERAQLKKGQKVLIHAGSGGVGTVAIQLAKHLGATVATTTSTENIALVERLGADVVVDYKKDDFAKVLTGYDVVLNSLCKDTLAKSLAVLKPGGKLISISGPPDVAFAKEGGWNIALQQLMRLLSFGIRRKAKQHGVSYSFLFHAGRWRAVESDHGAHRIRRREAGRGSNVPVHRDQRSDELPGEGPRERKGRHQGEMKQVRPDGALVESGPPGRMSANGHERTVAGAGFWRAALPTAGASHPISTRP